MKRETSDESDAAGLEPSGFPEYASQGHVILTNEILSWIICEKSRTAASQRVGSIT